MPLLWILIYINKGDFITGILKIEGEREQLQKQQVVKLAQVFGTVRECKRLPSSLLNTDL